MKDKVEVIKRSVHCKINLSADDWQLYHIPGRNAAAKKLNSAVRTALKSGDVESAYAALSLFREYGATDSEGYGTLERILEITGFQ